MFYINDKLRIKKLDEYSLQLERLKQVKSRKDGSISDQWILVGYYGSLENALNGAIRYKLCNTADETTTLNNIVRKINAIKKDISLALNDKMNERAIDEATKKLVKRYRKILDDNNA